MSSDAPQSHPRKLFLFMDGTGNEIGDGQTNVLKLYRSFKQDDLQQAYYMCPENQFIRGGQAQR